MTQAGRKLQDLTVENTKYSILNTHYRNGRATGASQNTRKEKLCQL